MLRVKDCVPIEHKILLNNSPVGFFLLVFMFFNKCVFGWFVMIHFLRVAKFQGPKQGTSALAMLVLCLSAVFLLCHF